MSRSFGIVNIVVILFIAALLTGYMNYIHKENDEIERLKLSYAIDYSTDAGAAAMLETGSLDMDYTKNKSFTVDPQLALDTFLDVFCFNYDMQPTAENKALIKDYIPVATVATFDGFYLASQQQVKNGGGNYPDDTNINAVPKDVGWDLIFGMKMPYTYNFGSTSYALNMGLDYSLALTGSSLTKEFGLPPTAAGTMSLTEAKATINTIISNDMAYSIDKTNELNPNWKNSFYIPSQLTTFSGVNPIEGPSFIVLVQGLNITTSRPISGFSLSGSKIDAVRMIAGYTRGGIKYYSYVDKNPSGFAGLTIEDLFTTEKAAALKGYYFDTEFMQ
ncbi:hypothetical protein EHS13_29875 [Paenibacillus psychroresistens]|uniref:Uncharacterized protein n=1 Tax=Paenibacillus psychroresistens TaxID=1778678 RepID=A0A6B8RTA6_9BACL|nr:hypothetical protein [Paenibacillus psychroresistens]QGQ98785.1 hypothetical protein EHS13_29875 [Paenibacillus psychroresistens]